MCQCFSEGRVSTGHDQKELQQDHSGARLRDTFLYVRLAISGILHSSLATLVTLTSRYWNRSNDELRRHGLKNTAYQELQQNT